MAKIIIEHATKKPKIKLNVFIDEVKVGQISNQVPLEVDVPAGNHLLNIGFGAKEVEGIGIPFQMAEEDTKKVKTNLTRSALFAARWHVFLMLAATGGFSFAVTKLFFGKGIRAGVLILSFIVFLVGLPVYFFVKAKQKQNPKNFIDIEILE